MEIAMLPINTQYECFVLAVPPIELVDRVLAADEAEDDESIDKILCGALKNLKTVRAKPSPALYLGLMYLAKVKPMFFESENVIEVTRTVVFVIEPGRQSCVISIILSSVEPIPNRNQMVHVFQVIAAGKMKQSVGYRCMNLFHEQLSYLKQHHCASMPMIIMIHILA